MGYRTTNVEAHEDEPLGALLAPQFRTLLFELDRLAGAGESVKRVLRVLRSLVGGLNLSMGEAAWERRSAVGLFVDEIQYFRSKELGP